MEQDKKILLVAQKDAGTDNPELSDLYPVGTLANILQLLKLPDGTVKVLPTWLSHCLSAVKNLSVAWKWQWNRIKKFC
jgi:ATP-dependent Lon protease